MELEGKWTLKGTGTERKGKEREREGKEREGKAGTRQGREMSKDTGRTKERTNLERKEKKRREVFLARILSFLSFLFLLLFIFIFDSGRLELRVNYLYIVGCFTYFIIDFTMDFFRLISLIPLIF